MGLAAMLWFATGTAQTRVTLTFQDASTQAFEVSAYGKIFFSDQFIYIDEGDAVPFSFAVSDVRNMVFSEVLGVRDIVSENVKIFPNPVRNDLFVSLDNPEPQPFSLYASDGRVVRQGFCENGTPVRVGDLPMGLYILKINNNSFKISKL